MIKYVLGAVLVGILGYGLVKAWPLLAGPSVTLTSPAENASFLGGIVVVQGNAVRAASLTLNGAPLLHDQSGVFSSTLTFPKGGSILTLVVTDRFGRSVTERRSIFVPSTNN